MDSFRELYSTISDKQRDFLLFLAFNLSISREDYIRAVSGKINYRITDLKIFIRELEDKGLISKRYFSWDEYYELDSAFQNFLLKEIALLSEDRFAVFSDFLKYNLDKDKITNLDIIISYLKSGIKEKFIFPETIYSNNDNYLLRFALSWMKDKVLYPLIFMIDEDSFIEFWNKLYIKSIYTLDNDDINQALFLADKYEFGKRKKEIQEKLAFFDFLRGDIEKVLKDCDKNSALNKYFNAFIYLGQHRYAESLKYFNAAMKVEGTKFPENPFFRICYRIALYKSPTATNKNKALKEDNSNDYFYDEKIFIELIQLKNNCRDEDYVKEKYSKTNDYQNRSRLLRYFIDLYLEYLKISDFIAEDYILIESVRTSEFKMLAMTGVGIFDSYTDYTLNNEFNIDSFLEKYTYEPAWEKLLNQLIDERERGESVITDEDKESRIVYVMTSSGVIQPKLQKRLKSTNQWSKGRDISLATFYKGVTEMDKLDLEISNCIERVFKSYYYSSKEEYIIDSKKALKILINKNRLFTDSDPMLPIDIIEETPYIAISKIRNKYNISSNYLIKDNEDDLTCAYFNGNTQIKLISITNSQKELIKTLLLAGDFPIEAKEKLIRLISSVSKDITIHSDLIASASDVVLMSSDNTIIVQLLPKGKGFRIELFVKPLGDVQPYCKPGIGIRTVVGEKEGQTVQVTRDYKKENENLQTVKSFLSEADITDERNEIFMVDTPWECLDILENLQGLEMARVEWPEGVKLKLVKQVSSGDFSVSVRSKLNWFEISGNLKIGENISLTLEQILEQFSGNPGRKFIELGEGEYIGLTEELRKSISSFDSLSVKDKGILKISQFIAPSLSAFEKEGIRIDGDTGFKTLVNRIDEASKKEYPVPQRLQASLREYQEEGYRWMAKLSEWGSGACLADDMGLGKTLQAIAMMLHRAEKGASLVVAPASVLLNWLNEINRFAPALNCLVLNSGANRSEIIKDSSAYDIVLTTYGLLITENELQNKDWNMVVLDEAHTIKNRDTKMSKSAMKIKADFRLILTGTPIQNHLSEIWNLFQFMNPGLLGSFEHFQNRFILPIEVEKNMQRKIQLKNMISPFMLRRTKNEVLQDLPGKTEILISVDQTKEEALFYEKLRYDAEQRLNNKEMTAIQTLAEITKLRQAASNMRLLDNTVSKESSKMEAFFNLYEEIEDNGHRALVFSQFTSHLALVREELEKRNIKYLYLDGSTPVTERAKLVKKFQTGTEPIFLISLKAGGLGLNLTAADFVVHLDPWWNPAIEDQASDRAYRIGQKRPVTIYRLITKNTIEEKIIDLHHTKKDIADSLLEGSNMSSKLTRDDLIELLKGF